MTTVLVCSVCGSQNYGKPERSMDDRWLVARCYDHNDKRNPLTPLISASAFVRRSRIRRSEAPIDLFSSLPDDERDRLRKPAPLFPWRAKR